ncbi:DUF1540 domain-containing protein [Bacillus marasmi]|uniref:DUF1540 domain-containing protein n=1 Tax=Bacillus marasmi TaxID=1926279 RepID=UPI0011CAE18C|nr:DUF1540 domain-containing protein [Bacillus marasmi]
MAQILCEVTNCIYNSEGKKCGAKEIFVGSYNNEKSVMTHEEIGCKTFATRN